MLQSDIMNKSIIYSLLLVFFLMPAVGCYNSKETATRQRWQELKTATENLTSYIALSSQASAPHDPSDAMPEYIQRAKSTLDACKAFHEALKSQSSTNVEPKLNAAIGKLVIASEKLLNELQNGLDAMTVSLQLIIDAKNATTEQEMAEIASRTTPVFAQAAATQEKGAAALTEIQVIFDELETIRVDFNSKYKIEFLKIKWINQL